MALSQTDRIEISRKQITIPLDQQGVNDNKVSIQQQIVIAQASDDIGKTLESPITAYINPYQLEIERYDGNGRTQLVEQDFIDSANKIKQNPFFPNDTLVPLPSISDGVWKNFSPFSKNKAIGKLYNELYNAVPNEAAKISAILSTISSIEAATAQTRSSGEDCTSVGAPPVDTIAPNTSIQSLISTLIGQINDIRSFSLGTKSAVPAVYVDNTMLNENNAAKAAVDTLVAAVDAWLAFPDFTTIAATTCSVFDVYDVTTLPPTKLRATELNPLKIALNNKTSFNSTRISQIDSHLGTIVVNSKGNITSATGWYGDRFRIIDIRLNLISGTLSDLTSLQDSLGSQDEILAASTNVIFVYNTLMTTSLFRAPASGNKTIHLVDSSSFSVGDSIFVISEGKPEISANILSISGNTIGIDVNTPRSYTPDSIGRVYKVL